LNDAPTNEESMAIGVMICDDHPAFARGLGSLLEQEAADIEVAAVVTSVEDLERAARQSPPDVLLLDLRMPGTDGIEAARRMRAMAPGTRIVVLTASDDQSDLYKALKAGASGYVLKESDVSEIAGAVRSVFRGHLVIPAHLVGSFVHDLEEADPASLSDLERDILDGIARGETNREIAERLHMSERTVRRRVEDVYAKLHVTDRLQAAMYASKQGFGGGGR
jgi:DNA-binding NarL/FixJ family response regulator